MYTQPLRSGPNDWLMGLGVKRGTLCYWMFALSAQATTPDETQKVVDEPWYSGLAVQAGNGLPFPAFDAQALGLPMKWLGELPLLECYREGLTINHLAACPF